MPAGRFFSFLRHKSALRLTKEESVAAAPAALTGKHADTIVVLRKIAQARRKNRPAELRAQAEDLRKLRAKQDGGSTQVKPPVLTPPATVEPTYILNARTMLVVTEEDVTALKAKGGKLLFAGGIDDSPGVYLKTAGEKDTAQLKRVGRIEFKTPPRGTPITTITRRVDVTTENNEMLISVKLPALDSSTSRNPMTLQQGDMNYKLRLPRPAKKEG